MKYYCDTNFIIRYLVAGNQEMFVKTDKIFKEVKSGKILFILEQTVFTEVIFVLSSFYKVPRDKIFEALSGLLSYKGIICDHKEALLLALDIYNKQALHIVDCLLIAKSKINNLPILSFDQKLMNINSKEEETQ